jgi:hypothetical protein
MVAEFRSTSGLIKNMIINKFHTTYLMFYWNFLIQALLLTAINSQCSGADLALIETGTYFLHQTRLLRRTNLRHNILILQNNPPNSPQSLRIHRPSHPYRQYTSPYS